MRMCLFHVMLLACGVCLLVGTRIGWLAHPEGRSVLVAVARVDIKASTIMANPEDWFVLEPYLADTAPPEAISRLEDLRGKAIMAPIRKGYPCTTEHLRDTAWSYFKPAPAGCRAVTLRIPALDPATAHRLLGVRVDLVFTGPDPLSGRTCSTVFLQNVMVIATGGRRPQDEARPDGVVTLAVLPQDVARVIWAKDNGTLALAVRQPEDTSVVRPHSVTGLTDAR